MQFLEPIFFCTDILGDLKLVMLLGNHLDCKVLAQEKISLIFSDDTAFTQKYHKCAKNNLAFDFQ